MRAGSGQPLHRPLSNEPSGGGERHALGPPVRQYRQGGAARRAGYVPALFGYTDQSIDPRDATGPDDPRLSRYDEVLPGFDPVLHTSPARPEPWIRWLRDQGFEVPDDGMEALASEGERPETASYATFLTDTFLGWLDRRDGPWFAHLSHFRPHEPFTAAGRFGTLYRPGEAPPPISPSAERHWLHTALMSHPRLAAPTDPDALARMQAQYFGMISEVDHQLGRVWAALEARGWWDDTLIIVTSDHGEQLGDHGLIQKLGFFEGSFHILGIVRDPRPGKARGATVDRFTENIDWFPTLCEALGLPVPAQCDGLPLTPFLDGENAPAWWRTAAHWEFDWRFNFLRAHAHGWPRDRVLERQTLAVRRTGSAAYVHFGDGSSLAFDLAADPTWRTPLLDPATRLNLAEGLLQWRAEHLDRTLTGMLVEDGGVGRWPPSRDD